MGLEIGIEPLDLWLWGLMLFCEGGVQFQLGLAGLVETSIRDVVGTCSMDEVLERTRINELLNYSEVIFKLPLLSFVF